MIERCIGAGILIVKFEAMEFGIKYAHKRLPVVFSYVIRCIREGPLVGRGNDELSIGAEHAIKLINKKSVV